MDFLKHYNRQVKPFYDIKGCAFNVYNWYHGGLDEIMYEAGLKFELEQIGYTVHRQEEFPVYYKDIDTGVRRRLDLVVDTGTVGKIILELKSVNYVDDKHRHQLAAYQRMAKIQYGMIINFGQDAVYTEIWEYDEHTNKSICISL